QGQIVSQVHDAGSSTTIDWNNGIVQFTAADCGPMTFLNMMEGGSYTLIVKGAVVGTCTFSQSDPDALEESDFKYLPVNGPTIADKETIYTFTRAGGTVYASWVSGF